MARFSCGLLCRGAHCSAHDGTGSKTAVEQKSQQVKATGIDSPKCYVEHDTPYDYPAREEMSEIPSRMAIDLDGIDEIIISEKLSRAIRKELEIAFVGSETDSNNEPESKLIICDGGCTTTLCLAVRIYGPWDTVSEPVLPFHIPLCC